MTAALLKIEAQLRAWAEQIAEHGHLPDGHELRVMAMQIDAQNEMTERGLVEGGE